MRRIVALLLGLIVAMALPAWAMPGVPAEGRLAYTVTRNGAPIGRLEFAFRPEGDRLAVEVTTEIVYKLAFLTLYRFNQRSREIWQGDRLIELISDTDDDGTRQELKSVSEADGVAVTLNGKPQRHGGRLVPSSLWHPAVVESPALIDTVDGSRIAVQSRFVGQETLSVRGRPMALRRYAITGDMKRDVWFDEAGVLRHVRFTARDGSDVAYVLD